MSIIFILKTHPSWTCKTFETQSWLLHVGTSSLFLDFHSLLSPILSQEEVCEAIKNFCLPLSQILWPFEVTWLDQQQTLLNTKVLPSAQSYPWKALSVMSEVFTGTTCRKYILLFLQSCGRHGSNKSDSHAFPSTLGVLFPIFVSTSYFQQQQP